MEEGKNVYLSGTDGARKTTMAHLMARWLNDEFGFQTRVVHFPTERSVSSSLLRLDMGDSPRIKLGAGARELLFVTDRLETMKELAAERMRNPQLWLIFDRGHVDGAVYAEATDRLRKEPIGITAGWIERCDARFTEAFPVNLGFYLTASVASAQLGMAERGRMDELDRNLDLQYEIREVFERYLEKKREWRRIEVDRFPGETLGSQEGRIFAIIKQHLRERIGEWTREGEFPTQETYPLTNKEAKY